ncbi:hypothetical protein OG806_40005 [Streptomyces sp. NBC_00882]|uniref:hypothetical protein n=1 Tax=Streptomyces TaxID=1883 RepID=UPI003866A560|nr:hypothetical protein OG806_40005 [Streptomyces sp. NBC_00882]WSZ62114.1 hypothetical protein OH824_38920 [Streptomyces canus]
MRSFTDQLMLRYLNHERVASLLAPLDDPDRNRVRSLLDAVYEPGTVEVRFVDSVEIAETSFQVPVSAPITVRGNWEKLPPDMAQARAVLEVPAVTPPDWIDMSVDAVVTARVALTSGALETLAHEDVSALSEDAFGAADSATLQAQFPQLYRVHYAEPPPFDPTGPGRTYRLRVSVLFLPELDLGAALRRLVLCRRALDAAHPRPDEYDGGALLAASAWLAVFPTAALPSDTAPGTAQQVSALLAAEGFVAAFEEVT